MQAEVFHVQNDSDHTVLLRALRVLIVPDGDKWFAQGVEINYAASGDSVDDVRRRFENGLASTIHALLEEFGNIEKLLKVTPPEEIDALVDAQKFGFTLITTHSLPANVEASNFPYKGVAYFEQRPAA